MADIPTFYPTLFDTSFSKVLQQESAVLAPTMTQRDIQGDRHHYNIMEDVSMTSITTRKGETPDGDFDGYKVWHSQSPYEVVVSFDEFDARNLGTIVLPTSDAVQNQVMARNRKLDDVLIAALSASRVTGTSGETSTAFPSGNKVAKDYVQTGSAANSGLTISKLRRTKFLMDSAYVPKTERFLAVTAQQIQDLLSTTEVTSADYNVIRALVQGEVDTFMGFKFVQTERLVTLETSVRACYAYHKKTVRFSAVERKTHMDYLPTKRHRLQIRTVEIMGAMRHLETAVQIACHEAP